MTRTDILVDTNAYLRLAQSLHPLLGHPFGEKSYCLRVLPELEKEYLKNPRLRSSFSWFEEAEYAKKPQECPARRENRTYGNRRSVRIHSRGILPDGLQRVARRYTLPFIRVCARNSARYGRFGHDGAGQAVRNYDMVDCRVIASHAQREQSRYAKDTGNGRLSSLHTRLPPPSRRGICPFF